MTDFATKRLPARRDVAAPDTSDVRIPLGVERGGMAHFELAPGRTTQFQFRSLGAEPLAAVGVTMPPRPGEGEAYEVRGKWEPV